MPHVQTESKIAVNRSQALTWLRQMLLIRRFEERSAMLYQNQKIGGFCHLYSGQEPVAVGSIGALREDDYVITAYRDHGHALAVGMSMNECMAELFGKATGCSKGKGGSMHFFAPDKNYWGGHGIVAGQTPLGLGLAFAVKYKGLTGSCLSFLGDGAVNQGVYYECLNIASLWDLPVVYVIENNRYSMGTSLDRSSAIKNCLAERADGFGIVWDIANGEDIYEVRAKTWSAIERAHKESRPTVLEIDTYRHYGHSVADAKHKGGYRTAEEIEKFKNLHDPVLLWRRKMIEEGVVTDEEADAIDKETRAEAAAAVKFAEESPVPTIEAIQQDVYFEVDRQTEAGRTGRHFFND
jgi:pyruvate dehydrogenase E1 component alpha subunit